MVAKSTSSVAVSKEAAEANDSSAYELPVLHVRVPDKFVDVGFWAGLSGAVALGVVDLPLAVLVGAGVVVARHQLKK